MKKPILQDGTFTMRIPSHLLVSIKAYAKSKNTNVTQLVIDYFKHLVDTDDKQEADQV